MRPTTTGPVLSPMRIRSGEPALGLRARRPKSRSARWMPRAAWTARRGLSSCAMGAPKSAITPSPVYWLMVPSNRWTSAVMSSKQRSMMRVHVLGVQLLGQGW